LKKICFFYFLFFLFVSSFVFVATESENLALLDNYKYEPQHYQFLIEKLREYTTTTDERMIAAVVSNVQSELEKEFPGITIYNVALGIKKTAETFYDKDGGRKQDLKWSGLSRPFLDVNKMYQ